jgi:hypothetical protein
VKSLHILESDWGGIGTRKMTLFFMNVMSYGLRSIEDGLRTRVTKPGIALLRGPAVCVRVGNVELNKERSRNEGW